MAAFTETLSVGRTRVFKWANVTDDDFDELGEDQGLGDTNADVTMVLTGADADGEGVKLQGSHDNSNWVDVVDPDGTVIILTVLGTYAAARDVFPYMRPLGNGGGGASQDITITVSVTRAA